MTVMMRPQEWNLLYNTSDVYISKSGGYTSQPSYFSVCRAVIVAHAMHSWISKMKMALVIRAQEYIYTASLSANSPLNSKFVSGICQLEQIKNVFNSDKPVGSPIGATFSVKSGSHLSSFNKDKEFVLLEPFARDLHFGTGSTAEAYILKQIHQRYCGWREDSCYASKATQFSFGLVAIQFLKWIVFIPNNLQL